MVIVYGWIDEIRDKGKIIFLVLSSFEGKYQITLKKGIVPDGLMEKVRKLSRQSTIKVEGKKSKKNC